MVVSVGVASPHDKSVIVDTFDKLVVSVDELLDVVVVELAVCDVDGETDVTDIYSVVVLFATVVVSVVSSVVVSVIVVDSSKPHVVSVVSVVTVISSEEPPLYRDFDSNASIAHDTITTITRMHTASTILPTSKSFSLFIIAPLFENHTAIFSYRIISKYCPSKDHCLHSMTSPCFGGIPPSRLRFIIVMRLSLPLPIDLVTTE